VTRDAFRVPDHTIAIPRRTVESFFEVTAEECAHPMSLPAMSAARMRPFIDGLRFPS
jgi:diadenosine tetraphosphate (Ap4A) HIT family hydrolase